MDYQKLINKLVATSKRVSQLELLASSIMNEVEHGTMDLAVHDIIKESISKINNLYTMKGNK